MSAYPLFVPHESEQLSAVLVAPESAASVAVFPLRVPALGMSGSTFWATAATRLASQGIASVRFESTGSGDSSGELIGPFDNIDVVTRQAITIAEFAMDILGIAQFSAAGACFNGAVALAAARDPRCTAAVSINTPPGSRPGVLGVGRRTVAKWALVDAVRTRPALRRVLLYDRVRSLLRDNPSPFIRDSLASSSRTARVLLIHDERHEMRNIANLPGQHQIRKDIPFGAIRIDGGELTEGEERVLDVAVDWLVAASAGDRRPEPVAEVASATRRS